MKRHIKSFVCISATITLILTCTSCALSASSDASNASSQNNTSSVPVASGNAESSIEGSSVQSSASAGSGATSFKPSGSSKPSGNKPAASSKPASNKTSSETETNKCAHPNCYISPNPFHDKEKYPFPTCTKSGFYSKYCPDCHESWYEEAKAKGHSGGVATCIRKAECVICKNEYGSLDKNNHNGLRIGCNDNAYAATCEKSGYTGDKAYCPSCNTTVEKGKTIKALGHQLDVGPYEYDKNKDKIKEHCNRQNCNYVKYTDVSPLTVRFERCHIEICGGVFPEGKCYIITSKGREEVSLISVKEDMFYREYNIVPDDLSVGDIFEFQAFDKSGRELKRKYEIIEFYWMGEPIIGTPIIKWKKIS